MNVARLLARSRGWDGATTAGIAMALLAVAVVVVPTLAPDAAFASASGTDGPGGTVSVGASDGGWSPGSPGSPGAASTPGTTPASSGDAGLRRGTAGGSPWTCTFTPLLLNDLGGFAPGGPTPGGWFSVTCVDRINGASTTQTEWITSRGSAGAPAPSAAPPVDPRMLALQAENSLRLPTPILHFNPAASSVVNLPTWLWIDPLLWHQLSVTASAGSVSATALATPQSVTWQMGDGGRVVCSGPGRPFDLSHPAQQPTSDCQYTYRVSSLGQATSDGNPDDASFPVRATVTWAVSWNARGAPGQGVLPPLATTAAASVRVVQVESINSGSSGVPGGSNLYAHQGGSA